MTDINSSAGGSASGLALSVVEASTLPTLLLDGNLSVIAASSSFGVSFEVDPVAVQGSPVAAIADGAFGTPSLSAMLRATASGLGGATAYEMTLSRGDGATQNIVLEAKRLDYGSPNDVRVLLTVTEPGAASNGDADELLRENQKLQRQLQSRVANSLQVIAAVLLQSASKVTSGDTGSRLRTAHDRVLSIAMVQEQLAVSGERYLPLRAYFQQLCDSLSGSMITDPSRLALDVRVDDSIASADGSVSLGLIVTELVINAIRHAFPDNRQGRIVLDYQSDGAAWTLSVTDDGIGMPSDPAKTGLGTGIVRALSQQLHATVHVADAGPGTIVSIVHLPDS